MRPTSDHYHPAFCLSLFVGWRPVWGSSYTRFRPSSQVRISTHRYLDRYCMYNVFSFLYVGMKNTTTGTLWSTVWFL
ncbi:hypothetical protein GGS24DRAFT_468014 [Hypoxylon argillaceum]|nr:hypothetical protein GGS24DRAFT_468014 [Hypoxylon argillaceum]